MGSLAHIWFDTIISALIAQRALDGYQIKELGLVFKVDMTTEERVKEPFGGDGFQFKSIRKGSGFSQGTNQTSVMFLKNNQKLVNWHFEE